MTRPSAKSAIVLVAALNLGYFCVELGVALAIGSVSLLADSIDFLEDTSINALILAGLAWTAAARARLGRALALVILMPGLAALWTAWQKLGAPLPPAALPLTIAGGGALAVNLTCARVLARYRHGAGSLMKAAFLSARNDVLANIAIIVAGLTTAWIWHSAWPDLIVGLGIAALNAGAALEVWEAATREGDEAEA
ncbi:MAG: cation transporter [Hyphomicrobiaceae bacterium]|nr:cation transporter [Hyphomicrobiaceae bacterium]